MTNLRAIFAFVLLALLAGCANYGSEKHFEHRPSVVEAAKATPDSPDRAVVYLFRKRLFMQWIIYVPIPPLFYAVDGKMLSVMPLGSHVKLSLEPGKHTFTSFALRGGDFGLLPIEFTRTDAVVDVSAGMTYYVGMGEGLNPPLASVSAEVGRELVADTELAQFIHQPVSVDTFTSRLVAMEAKRKGGAQSSQAKPASSNQSSVSARDALPSSKQVSEFLEVVATVALVALLVFGAAAGNSSNASAPPSTPTLASPPAIRQPVAQTPSSSATWRTSSGSLSQIVESKTERTVFNLSTGVRYRIEDGRITGTDGSRYRVAGSTVFSDSGQSYQVIGNNVFASDGRSCVKTGVIVSCK